MSHRRFGGRWKITAGDLDGDGTAEWSGTRYAYCGAWGYESGLLELAGADSSLPPIELIHVGARWYDPALGRFVQRDPIGILRGINTYSYTDASPLADVDPSGLYSDSGWDKFIEIRNGLSPEARAEARRGDGYTAAAMVVMLCVYLAPEVLPLVGRGCCSDPAPYDVAPPDPPDEFPPVPWDPRWGTPPPPDDVDWPERPPTIPW